MTPLLSDIAELDRQIDAAYNGQQPDNLDSAGYVRVIGVFLQVYHNPEVEEQIRAMMRIGGPIYADE